MNRLNFGLDSFPKAKILLRWRVTDALFIILIMLLYGLFYNLPPFERQFFINDLTISHPFKEHEIVPNKELFFYAAFTPFFLLIISSLIITPKHRFYVTYLTLLGFVSSILFTSFLTDILKNWIGRPRPDFISRCDVTSTALENVLYTASQVCQTEDLEKLKDGFRSCPSGHSSISWAGLGYLSLWLLGQTCSAHHGTGLWRTLISIIPTIIATLIALSRTQDYRHRFSDVTIGSLVGALIGYWSYRRYFPSIKSRFCYMPTQLIVENNLSSNNYLLHENEDFEDGYHLISTQIPAEPDLENQLPHNYNQ
ncbi:bifunctional diacylglycerol diphosphate phosphatase/phosphatidate phosphatase [Ascoidea rubescens DSM 1968]|uniref:PAP2-domain-containing protein n=1 Tax=Ascoidea rubescens DSM 1968 TaxID=1344418 RepID=A0A1D2VDY1_9ASCO|nr:PAP2-domain-containing protein [Ascoidea rubescens DSM 1968]ODV59836.1 PAP2-domain-containing protein [Ascoidea rubescens DSM 1968]